MTKQFKTFRFPSSLFWRCILLVIIFPAKFYPQDNMDSLVKLVPSLQGEKKVLLLSKISENYLWEQGDHAKGSEYAKMALQLAQQISDKYSIAISYQAIGLTDNYTGKYQEAIISYEKGLSYLNQTPESNKKKNLTKARMLLNLGKAYAAASNISKGSALQIEAIRIYENESEKNITAGIEHMAGNNVNVSSDNFSLKYVEEFAKAHPDDSVFNEILSRGKNIIFNLRNSYYELGKYFLKYEDHKTAGLYLQKARYNAEYYHSNGYYREILQSIGDVYLEQKIHDSAIVYFQKAIIESRKEEDLQGLVTNTQKVADILVKTKKYPEALEAYTTIGKLLQPLKEGKNIDEPMYKKILRKAPPGRLKLVYSWIIAVNYNSISRVYSEMKEDKKARAYKDTAIKICEAALSSVKNEDRGMMMTLHWELGEMYLQEKNPGKAIYHLEKTLKDLNIEQDPESIIDLYKNISEAYELNGDWKPAMLYHKKYIHFKDSIYSQKSINEMAELQKRSEVEKKDIAIELLNKTGEAKQAEIEKQKLVRNGFIAGSIVFLILAIIIFQSLRKNRKAKKVIEVQKHLVEEKNKEVEEKNKDILDSIRYAKRIQTSLLPTEKYIDRILNKQDKSTGHNST